MARGTGYTISITPKWTATVYSEGYNVWADWNRDGDFADAGESVYVKALSTSALATGAFTIPATASLGTTRLRVQMKYNANATACEAFSYGEVEDYTLNVATTAREAAPVTADANAALSFNLYPNPTHSEVMLELNQFDGVPMQAQIFDVAGKQIATQKVDANIIIIDASNYQSGMYFVTIITADKQVITKKFVKN